MKFLLSGIFLVVCASCWGQGEFTIPLAKANPALSLPSMAVHDGIIYVAYRTFDLLQYSRQLQIIAYDLNTHKELRRVALQVAKVHGERASEGLYISDDGQTLGYAELHDPGLILLVATKNLAEIRRSIVLPFTSKDHQRIFAGFEGDQLCLASNVFEYGKPELEGLRFIRLRLSDLQPSSDTKIKGLPQQNPGSIIWLPKARLTWVKRGIVWKQYTEAGRHTGHELEHPNATSEGVIPLGETRLLAFYGRYADGSVIDYSDHRTSELKLQCSPHPYGSTADSLYAGAICTTQRDILPEAGGDKIVTSDFLLLKADGPAVIWHHPMKFMTVTDRGPDPAIQSGNPLLYSVGSKLLVVAPSKKPELTVYEIPLPESKTSHKPTTH